MVNDLVPFLKKAGFAYWISRTDNEEFRAFGFGRKQRPDQPDRYGEHIWGDRYYKI